jgi:RNA polymerase sigma-70 factor (ECF subfamily)
MVYPPSSFSDMSDDQLVQRARRGQTQAFEEIFRRYQQDVKNVVSGLLYRRQETEEIVQQVFVNAFVNLSTFQEGRDFGVWIRTIARNAVREQLRKQVRYDRRLQDYYGMLAARLDSQRSPADDQLREIVLRQCMEQLTEKAAQVIRWRYTDGRRISDIAAMRKTTANAISKLLARTRVTLRECVESRMRQS